MSAPGWRLTRRLPAGLRTVRVRLTLTYSALLFGITALVLVAVYFALSASIDHQPLDPVVVKKFERLSDGTLVYRNGETFQAADLTNVQQYVNYSTLDRLRDYGLLALAAMFVLSLAIGWWVAGRALRPVGRITAAAQDISATDLSLRIGATGPQDELRTLADTIDGMLARLDAAFEAERRLVEDVSHELRNPVAVVQANVEAVLASEDSTPDQRREALAIVTRATTRMSRLLEDLLATARLRSGSFEERPVDLARLVSETVDEARVLAAAGGTSLDARLPPGPLVYAEPAGLARAVGNLVSNALRVAAAGTVVTVAVGSIRGWAWAAVRDEGPGIPEDDHAVIFERFRRATGDTRDGRAEGGAGLGLAIARQIVESHQGRVVLASEVGVGSTFVIWLPDRAVPTDGERERAEHPPTGDPLGPRVRS